MPIQVLLHCLVSHVRVVRVLYHSLKPFVVSFVKLKLSEGFFFLLSDSVELSAHLVEASLQRAVINRHCLDSIPVELVSCTWAFECWKVFSRRLGLCVCGDEVISDSHWLDQIIPAA